MICKKIVTGITRLFVTELSNRSYTEGRAPICLRLSTCIQWPRQVTTMTSVSVPW